MGTKEKGRNKNAINPTFKGVKGDVHRLSIFNFSFFERRQIRALRCVILVGGILLTTFLISCKGDDIDLPDEPLSGTIGGVEWENKFSNGYLFSSELKYKMLLLSKLEPGDDPCPIISSSNPHLQMILPLNAGSYSLPLPVFEENVQFVIGDGTILRATSGFIEVLAVDFDSQQLVGYLQADFDEDNNVFGTFIIELC